VGVVLLLVPDTRVIAAIGWLVVVAVLAGCKLHRASHERALAALGDAVAAFLSVFELLDGATVKAIDGLVTSPPAVI
jgi:hypothetical protein